jgi:hypothetical protein
MPTQQYIRLRMPNGHALTTGRTVYAAKLSLGTMTQLYTSGPFFNVHAGSIPFVNNDYAQAIITNSRGAGGTLATWQTLFYQLLAPYMGDNELMLPSSSVPTISDALI